MLGGVSTTIRVPQHLHQRLATRAAESSESLAAVIEHALDAEESARFWEDVRRTMTGSAPMSDLARTFDAGGGTLRDGLDPEETWDDVL
jgi:hypothetical protein